MARLSLTLLGGFQAHLDDGRALALPLRKTQALLAYLAIHRGKILTNDKLAALLWGDMQEAPEMRYRVRTARALLDAVP